MITDTYYQGCLCYWVTPETDENINKTIEKTRASFSLVHDNYYAIMKAYANYAMDTAIVAKYKDFGVDLEENPPFGNHAPEAQILSIVCAFSFRSIVNVTDCVKQL